MKYEITTDVKYRFTIPCPDDGDEAWDVDYYPDTDMVGVDGPGGTILFPRAILGDINGGVQEVLKKVFKV